MLSHEEKRAIDAELARHERPSGACIEALRAVQSRRGWVSDQALRDVAAHLGMSTAELDSVATFYNLVFRRPVGDHVILLCTSISCWMLGCDALRERLRERLGVAPGETTADGRFTLLPIQCLGTCDRAPALMVDEDLHRDLDPGKLDRVLEEYAK